MTDDPTDDGGLSQTPTETDGGAGASARDIGPYRLLHKLGEGGMGEVWLAEQTEPVKRTVALKVIKHGMDTKQVVARFEAERQALALMDHPCVAKVFDAGSTPRGCPYFVIVDAVGFDNQYAHGVRFLIARLYDEWGKPEKAAAFEAAARTQRDESAEAH